MSSSVDPVCLQPDENKYSGDTKSSEFKPKVKKKKKTKLSDLILGASNVNVIRVYDTVDINYILLSFILPACSSKPYRL